jgi:hypothetical protein
VVAGDYPSSTACHLDGGGIEVALLGPDLLGRDRRPWTQRRSTEGPAKAGRRIFNRTFRSSIGAGGGVCGIVSEHPPQSLRDAIGIRVSGDGRAAWNGEARQIALA